MTAPNDTLAVLNERLATLTIRSLWLALLVALFSTFSAVASTRDGRVSPSVIFAGVIIALCGSGMRQSYKILGLAAPGRARRWMLNVAYTLIASGAVLATIGARALLVS